MGLQFINLLLEWINKLSRTSLSGGLTFTVGLRFINLLLKWIKKLSRTSRKGGKWGAPRESHARSAGWNVGKRYNRCEAAGAATDLRERFKTLQASNALLSYPPELRKRIEVVAICPSCYISEEICARVLHICSKNDFVHLLDRKGRKMALEQNTVVEVGHPNAPFFDHSITSDTLADAIRIGI